MNKFFPLLFVAAMLVSCSSVVDSADREESVRFLSAVPGNGSRTSLVDGGLSGISAKWLQGDSVSVFNLTSPSDNDEYMFALSTAQSTSFQGYVSCKASDRIALFYPAANRRSVINHDGRKEVQLTLYAQDGTLEGIARKYDFCYGIATVSAVNGFYATASLGTFVNLMSIYRITFQQADGTPITGVTSLTISSDKLCPTKNFNVEDGTFTDAIVSTELPLLFSEPRSTVYLAMFPAEDIEYDLTLTISDGTAYTANVPSHTIKAAGFYDLAITTNE